MSKSTLIILGIIILFFFSKGKIVEKEKTNLEVDAIKEWPPSHRSIQDKINYLIGQHGYIMGEANNWNDFKADLAGVANGNDTFAGGDFWSIVKAAYNLSYYWAYHEPETDHPTWKGCVDEGFEAFNYTLPAMRNLEGFIRGHYSNGYNMQLEKPEIQAFLDKNFDGIG